VTLFRPTGGGGTSCLGTRLVGGVVWVRGPRADRTIEDAGGEETGEGWEALQREEEADDARMSMDEC
jgi:hypothetical protein